MIAKRVILAAEARIEKLGGRMRRGSRPTVREGYHLAQLRALPHCGATASSHCSLQASGDLDCALATTRSSLSLLVSILKAGPGLVPLSALSNSRRWRM